MADSRQGFVFYKSYAETARLLPADQQLTLYNAIIDFALDETEPQLEFPLNIAFTQIKANLKSCVSRYDACVKNGKKGGNPNFGKGRTNPYYKEKKITKDNQADNLNKNDNDNSYLSVSEGGGSKPSPPPRKKKTCTEEQFQMDGEWYEYYIADDGERRVRKIDRQPQ